MLDECKGDKLMEVLVIFSTAVLRKTERARTSSMSSVSARLAVANDGQQASLLPLAVAHSASLARISRRREQQSARFTQFNNLLDGKYLQLQERLEASEATRRTPTADADGTQVQKVLHLNWNDTSWTHTTLCGDEGHTGGDSPLEMPFDDVWAAVSEGANLQSQVVEKGV
jgi:hypothetical protein